MNKVTFQIYRNGELKFEKTIDEPGGEPWIMKEDPGFKNEYYYERVSKVFEAKKTETDDDVVIIFSSTRLQEGKPVRFEAKVPRSLVEEIVFDLRHHMPSPFTAKSLREVQEVVVQELYIPKRFRGLLKNELAPNPLRVALGLD